MRGRHGKKQHGPGEVSPARANSILISGQSFAIRTSRAAMRWQRQNTFMLLYSCSV